MRARSILFTLYLEYLHQGQKAWIGHLIYWMRALGYSEPAVRAAVARSLHSGWVIPHKEGRRAHYQLAPRVEWQVARVRERLYPSSNDWDGRWRLLAYSGGSGPLGQRAVRDRFRSELALLGFGSPWPGVWLAPTGRLERALELVGFYGLGQQVELFEADRLGGLSAQELVVRAFPLETAQQRYGAFLEQDWPQPQTPQEAFVALTQLVHQTRKLLFLDPQLPEELYPQGFRGPRARRLFETLHLQYSQAAQDWIAPG